MDAFGPTLDYFCKRQGILLKELADQMRVGRNTIGNWKAKGGPSSRDDTEKLAKVLNLDEVETNALLTAAGYAHKYEAKGIDLASLSHIDALNVKHLMVEHIGMPKDNIQPPSARCDFYEHVSLPPNYVERPQVLTALRAALLSNAPATALTSAVQSPKPHALQTPSRVLCTSRAF